MSEDLLPPTPPTLEHASPCKLHLATRADRSLPQSKISIVYEGWLGIDNFDNRNLQHTIHRLSDNELTIDRQSHDCIVGASGDGLKFADDIRRIDFWNTFMPPQDRFASMSVGYYRGFGNNPAIVVFLICKDSLEVMQQRFQAASDNARAIIFLEVITGDQCIPDDEKAGLIKDYPCARYLQFSLSHPRREDLIVMFETAVELSEPLALATSRTLSDSVGASAAGEPGFRGFIAGVGVSLSSAFRPVVTASAAASAAATAVDDPVTPVSNIRIADADDRPHDYLLKFLLVGETSSGKSCLLLRFADNTLTPNFLTTIGVDFKVKALMIDDKKIKLQIWDTAGQERFRTTTTHYYSSSQGIMLVYDPTDRASFDKIKQFHLPEIQAKAADDVCLVLVANRSSSDDSAVSTEEACAFATEKNITFIEVDTRISDSVNQAFFLLADAAYRRQVSPTADAFRGPN